MNTLTSEIKKNLSVIKNSFWLISEKIISIFGLIFITSYVAVYIGPDNFGKLSFAISIFVIIQTLSMLGTDTVLFKRISKNRLSGIKLMLSTTTIRWLIYIIISTIYIIYCIATSDDKVTIIFTISVALSYLFLTVDHYAIYFNAILKSKINVIFNTIGLSFSLGLRYIIVIFKLDISYLAIPIITTTFLPYFFRFIYFHIKKDVLVIKTNKKNYISYLVKSGSPIAISNVSISIYSKISQLCLAILVSNYALGIFTVAFTLAYAWLFIPQSIITSFFSRIYQLKNKQDIIKETAILSTLILVISFVYLIFVYFLGDKLLFYLYGSEYTDSLPLLFYLSISSVLSSFGTIAYRYIVAFSGYSFLSKKMLFTSITGIILTYYLISNYKISGAVASILTIEIFSLTLLNYFFNKGIVFKMHITTIANMFKLYSWLKYARKN